MCAGIVVPKSIGPITIIKDLSATHEDRGQPLALQRVLILIELDEAQALRINPYIYVFVQYVYKSE